MNRWLGGAAVVLRHVARVVSGDAGLLVVDVGTGGADIPRRLVRWGAAAGRSVTVLAVDKQLQIARFAHRACSKAEGIQVAVADGTMLPLAAKSVDVAMTSMTLHHFPTKAAIGLVAEMARVSRRTVVVNDLHRHPLNYLGARFLAATVWRGDPYTRHDGPLSVLRSFTTSELLEIGETAGLRDLRVHRHFPYRLALVGRPA